ncbi:MAG: ATP-binding protein [Actinomycetota bacterium]|nr:ATP-binding protein [Actinomycetota bacterium]
MAVVLAAVALVLYLRFESQLDETFNQGLRSRAGDISTLMQRADAALSDPGGSVLVERGESFAQILSPDGTVVDATGALRGGPLLKAGQLRRADDRTIIVERPNPFEADEPARLLATPVRAQGKARIVVIGAGIDDRNSSLHNLGLLLALGMPVALALAAVAGYGFVTAALRPVEAMRRTAAQVSEHDSGERLPVAQTDDEIARLGTTLNAMLARLEAAFARERTFVADASHELRTPLAILKTELELALRRGRKPEELRAALQSAAEETERLAQLAEALLVIARSDERGLALTRSAMRTDGLLDGVRRRFELRLRDSGRRVVVDDGPPTQIAADPGRLQQALDNLVENALRHGSGDVRLASQVRDGHIELHVRDAGDGFPDDFIGRAFERFTRADLARGRGGSGLGLAIVRVIARAHGGEAHAANAPSGGGADVWIELPATIEMDEDRAYRGVAPSRSLQAGDRSGGAAGSRGAP